MIAKQALGWDSFVAMTLHQEDKPEDFAAICQTMGVDPEACDAVHQLLATGYAQSMSQALTPHMAMRPDLSENVLTAPNKMHWKTATGIGRER